MVKSVCSSDCCNLWRLLVAKYRECRTRTYLDRLSSISPNTSVLDAAMGTAYNDGEIENGVKPSVELDVNSEVTSVPV